MSVRARTTPIQQEILYLGLQEAHLHHEKSDRNVVRVWLEPIEARLSESDASVETRRDVGAFVRLFLFYFVPARRWFRRSGYRPHCRAVCRQRVKRILAVSFRSYENGFHFHSLRPARRGPTHNVIPFTCCIFGECGRLQDTQTRVFFLSHEYQVYGDLRKASQL